MPVNLGFGGIDVGVCCLRRVTISRVAKYRYPAAIRPVFYTICQTHFLMCCATLIPIFVHKPLGGHSPPFQAGQFSEPESLKLEAEKLPTTTAPGISRKRHTYASTPPCRTSVPPILSHLRAGSEHGVFRVAFGLCGIQSQSHDFGRGSAAPACADEKQALQHMVNIGRARVPMMWFVANFEVPGWRLASSSRSPKFRVGRGDCPNLHAAELRAEASINITSNKNLLDR